MDSVGSSTADYYYDDQWRVLLETDDSHNEICYYVFGNYIDEVVMMVDDLDSTAVDHYYGHDHLFSPVILFASNGTVLERYEYDAYGNMTRLDPDLTAWSGTEAGNPYYFTGRRLDVLDGGDLKIMYYRNRYYDPETGRFLTSDPLGINPSGQINNPFSPLSQYTDGMNLYEYVQSNPVMNIDVYGLEDSEDKEWLQEWEEWLEEIEWSEDYPDPWKDPKDVLCDKWTGVKKKACELFYKCLITWDRGKSIACNFAAKHCQVKCKKYYDKDLTKCNLYCQEKEAKCNL